MVMSATPGKIHKIRETLSLFCSKNNFWFSYQDVELAVRKNVSNLENRTDAEYELPNIIIEHVAMNPRNNNLNEIFLAYYRVM